MRPVRLIRSIWCSLLLGATLGALSACGTLSSLDTASRVLDTYELTPLTGSGSRAGNGPVLYVVEPSGSAAFQSDRIVVKPSPMQVTFLPDARWVETTPLLFQRLLRQSLVNSGRFGFVSSDPAGPVSDYSVVSDILAFEVNVGSTDTGAYSVSVQVGVSLVRDSDQRVLASRRFDSATPIADVEALTVVSGFEAANQAALREIADWIVSNLAGRSS